MFPQIFTRAIGRRAAPLARILLLVFLSASAEKQNESDAPVMAPGDAEPIDYSPFGPLAGFIGTWEGIRGNILYPTKKTLKALCAEELEGTGAIDAEDFVSACHGNLTAADVPQANKCYVERQTYTPMWPTVNDLAHANESIYTLAYTYEVSLPTGEPYHQESGQWRWVPSRNLLIRVIANQRNQVVQAASDNWQNGDPLKVSTTATLQDGSPMFGVGVLDLDGNSKVAMTAFESTHWLDESTNTLWYTDVSTLRIDGQVDFPHRAANCLTRFNSPHPVNGPSCPSSPYFCAAESMLATDSAERKHA